MGWSYAVDAGRTMDRWTDACVKATGSSNVFPARGTHYFWETSRVEHADGAITGTVFRMAGIPKVGTAMCARRAGSFRINGDGTIARAPGWLKTAATVPSKREGGYR